MAHATAQQIALGVSRRPASGKKKTRRFATGGAIDDYGNDLTRSNQMGPAADQMRRERLSSGVSEPSPAVSTPDIGNPAMRDLNTLGAANPVGSGLGAGANYGWSTLTSAEKAEMAGLDPHAPSPTYRANGQMTRQSIADLTPPPQRRAPAPGLMPSIDSLFPSRNRAFADGGVIGILQNRKKTIDAAIEEATNPNAPKPVADPTPGPAKPSMGSDADDYAAQAARIEAEQQAAAKARMAQQPKKKGSSRFTGERGLDLQKEIG